MSPASGISGGKAWKKPDIVNKLRGETSISNKGYGIPKKDNDEIIEQLRTVLTVKPSVHPDSPNASCAQEYSVYRENSTKFYIPRALGLAWFGNPAKDTLGDATPLPDCVQFAGKLRPEQEEPVRCFLEATADPLRRGGIISVPCAFGKTALSLYTIMVLKVKTVVICHKEFLINQWRERIQQFLPAARVGLIKAKVIDVEDKDIILASIQSLALKTYEPEVFRGVGFVIADEAHHLSAEVFSQCLPKVTCKYMLGLSATLNRKDGLRRVFEWFLGRPVYELRKRTESEMLIRMVPYYDSNPAYGSERFLWNGKKNVAKMVNAICEHPPRNQMIMDILAEVLAKEPGRRVLILSERRNHLKVLEELIHERKMGSTGYYVGGMKEAELKKSEDKDIILATLSMVSEGFDVPALNTLVLASPVGAIEQPIGRIQRQKKCDRLFIPYTIDIWDTFSIFEGQGFRRRKFYKEQGYTVLNKHGEMIEEDKDGGSDDGTEEDGESKCDVASKNKKGGSKKQPVVQQFIIDEDEVI